MNIHRDIKTITYGLMLCLAADCLPAQAYPPPGFDIRALPHPTREQIPDQFDSNEYQYFGLTRKQLEDRARALSNNFGITSKEAEEAEERTKALEKDGINCWSPRYHPTVRVTEDGKKFIYENDHFSGVTFEFQTDGGRVNRVRQIPWGCGDIARGGPVAGPWLDNRKEALVLAVMRCSQKLALDASEVHNTIDQHYSFGWQHLKLAQLLHDLKMENLEEQELKEAKLVIDSKEWPRTYQDTTAPSSLGSADEASVSTLMELTSEMYGPHFRKKGKEFCEIERSDLLKRAQLLHKLGFIALEAEDLKQAQQVKLRIEKLADEP